MIGIILKKIKNKPKKIYFDGPDIDIDWVKSNEMDSPAM
jgi:hypothetical protein